MRIQSLITTKVLTAVLLCACGAKSPRYRAESKPSAGLQEPFLDWETAETKALDLLDRLLSLDTSNPPGGELPAAKQLSRWLRREGIDAEVIRAGPNRGNVFARLDPTPGQPSKAPLLLLSHLDASPTEIHRWPVATPPFRATVSENKLWGRGLLDGKGLVVLHAIALLQLKRASLRRPILFAAVSDGARGDDQGISTLLKAHPEIGQSWLALTKGGATIRDLFGDGRTLHAIANSEKGFAVLRMTAAAPNANEVLSQALSRLYAFKSAARLSDPVLEVLDHISDQVWFPKDLAMRTRPLAQLFYLPQLAQRAETIELVKNTIEVTNIQSGVPQGRSGAYSARATLVCHLLPGTTPTRLRQQLRAQVGDSRVHINIRTGYEFSSSPLDPSVFEVIDRVMRTAPEQITTPFMSPETSDGRYLRGLGVKTYGFVPVELSPSELDRIHGHSENLPLPEFRKALKRMFLLGLGLSNLP